MWAAQCREAEPFSRVLCAKIVTLAQLFAARANVLVCDTDVAIDAQFAANEDMGEAADARRLEIESGGVWVRVPNQNCLSVCLSADAIIVAAGMGARVLTLSGPDWEGALFGGTEWCLVGWVALPGRARPTFGFTAV